MRLSFITFNICHFDEGRGEIYTPVHKHVYRFLAIARNDNLLLIKEQL